MPGMIYKVTLRRTLLLFYVILYVLVSSCSVYESESEVQFAGVDTVAPVISIDRLEDTAYLYTSYYPNDVKVLDENNGKLRCNGNPVRVSGELNLNLVGVYLLHYDVTDESGNEAATVTRTVHVVENKTAFMNGWYDVACTCTVVNRDSKTQTVTTSAYKAQISSEPVNWYFKIISLKIGKDHVTISTRLCDSVFDAGFFSPDYDIHSHGTGTLSASKNSFSIESVAYHYSGMIYRCNNIYKKKLVMKSD